MYNVYIDGDNICLERYFRDINTQVENITGKENYKITVVCQSNIIFKYNSERSFAIELKCCKTKNKNATDARIIYYAGMHKAKHEKVIIVSNDKIYEEIEEPHEIIVIGFPIIAQQKITKLRKRNIINSLARIRTDKGPSYDIYLSDLQQYFPTFSILDIRRYIESLHCVHISEADSVYVQTH